MLDATFPGGSGNVSFSLPTVVRFMQVYFGASCGKCCLFLGGSGAAVGCLFPMALGQKVNFLWGQWLDGGIFGGSGGIQVYFGYTRCFFLLAVGCKFCWY